MDLKNLDQDIDEKEIRAKVFSSLSFYGKLCAANDRIKAFMRLFAYKKPFYVKKWEKWKDDLAEKEKEAERKRRAKLSPRFLNVPGSLSPKATRLMGCMRSRNASPMSKNNDISGF